MGQSNIDNPEKNWQHRAHNTKKGNMCWTLLHNEMLLSSFGFISPKDIRSYLTFQSFDFISGEAFSRNASCTVI